MVATPWNAPIPWNAAIPWNGVTTPAPGPAGAGGAGSGSRSSWRLPPRERLTTPPPRPKPVVITAGAPIALDVRTGASQVAAGAVLSAPARELDWLRLLRAADEARTAGDGDAADRAEVALVQALIVTGSG